MLGLPYPGLSPRAPILRAFGAGVVALLRVVVLPKGLGLWRSPPSRGQASCPPIVPVPDGGVGSSKRSHPDSETAVVIAGHLLFVGA